MVDMSTDIDEVQRLLGEATEARKKAQVRKVSNLAFCGNDPFVSSLTLAFVVFGFLQTRLPDVQKRLSDLAKNIPTRPREDMIELNERIE